MSKLVLTDLGKMFGTVPAVQDVSLTLARGRIRLAAGAVGLRQDHDAAHDRGLHQPDRPARSR